MSNHTNKQISIPGTEKCLFLFLAPYARTTRYEEAFLPEGKKQPRSLRSLDLAMLNHTSKQLNKQINKHPWYRNMFVFLLMFLAPYARTTRYEEAFCSLENQGKKGSLRSRASLLVSSDNEARPQYLQ